MFKFAVDKLPLEMTGVNFRDLDNNKIDSCLYVSDIMEEINGDYSPFIPDYGVSGWYIRNFHTGPIFTIDPLGPHILYISGRPRSEELPLDHRNRFRLKNTIWVHFWEDNKYGYLTQIIEKKNNKL